MATFFAGRGKRSSATFEDPEDEEVARSTFRALLLNWLLESGSLGSGEKKSDLAFFAGRG